MHFMLYTPLSSTLFVTFFENLLPALVGEHDFQKCMNVKSCQKQLLKAFQSHGLHLFWSCLWHLEFAKSVRKMCISRLCTLFGSFVCPYVFYRMHFAWNLHIFGMLSSWVCFKHSVPFASPFQKTKIRISCAARRGRERDGRVAIERAPPDGCPMTAGNAQGPDCSRAARAGKMMGGTLWRQELRRAFRRRFRPPAASVQLIVQPTSKMLQTSPDVPSYLFDSWGLSNLKENHRVHKKFWIFWQVREIFAK